MGQINAVQTSARRKKAATPAPRRRVTSLASGWLHRAIVCLPFELSGGDEGPQERVVFFECPDYKQGRAAHLESLLSAAWGINATGLAERGYIYNIEEADERLRGGYSYAGEGVDPELALFETGCGGGGPYAVGPDRVHYARTKDVDLFVTPRAAIRLQEHLATIEAMYQAEPARLRQVAKSSTAEAAA